ncbi:MAG: UDP-N-acetylmuramoyl-L-alanine--D-glutamate ligase [Candidatus Eremiobacteraeota bacterium]|nr:UDP-N-acetylmuramoyl-L-alanine--D-glutamate ligase [Candidatus Eremiobacteraeota bacterium]MBC5803487.1 UDP-N-acetylmuramoyl-L-alanine--D-glutamate ligase [Candidatus Eremiobacteraeota bacterium]MBC5820468.1 UDP-N-acetylmuramoyl-L-alanine--D-glutamate ligase [Candidatus Eremiobacteraeota bacterium]
MNGQSGAFDAGEQVLVIGLGRSGIATCAVLRARGATVFATDEKDPELLAEVIAELGRSGIRFIPPASLCAWTQRLTSCVLSPGVPLNNELVRRVQAARVPVYSEIEVAYRISRAPLVAVTGTKGKTTTTALIGAMFARAGKTTHVGGNIGNALITETFTAKPADWVIAEVSSFQLESIRSFKPKIATILNLSPDHLDRYHSMDEYGEAKFRIFANQGPGDTFVGNLDDPAVGALSEGDAAKRIPSRALWFGITPHRNATLYLRGDRITYAPPSGDPRPVEIMPLDEIGLVGRHNVANVLAALLVGLAADLDPHALRAAVREFSGLPHRLEHVAESDGVLFIDDSKATNPGSVVAALESFDRPIVLIAGGKSKRTDFRAMGQAIARRAKAVVLIGEAAAEIAGVVEAKRTARATSMDEAVAIARALAVPGDVVLLSPGCASFDMFSSAEARGAAFARAAAGLAAVHG